MVPATGRTTNPVRANEAGRTSQDLLVKSASHGRASTRGGGHYVDRDERPVLRKVRSSLLSTHDHR